MQLSLLIDLIFGLPSLSILEEDTSTLDLFLDAWGRESLTVRCGFKDSEERPGARRKSPL
jgi:hypothetical protein